MPARGRFVAAAIAASTSILTACGGGSGGGSSPPPPGPAFVDPPASTRVSGTLDTTPACANVPPAGTLYPNAKVEPHVAGNPQNTSNLVGVWQQGRWSGGAAQAVVAAASFDGGATWARSAVPFSVCTGGTVANGGDFERATDPWVTVAPDGVAYQMALGVTADIFAAGSASGMRVARSTDGGRTWGAPVTLIRDGASAFNDKNSITADPTNASYVYAVWDRLLATGGGPAYFARTTDGGASWEAARSIYDPGVRGQTLGSVIAVLPNGTLLNVFNRITALPNNELGSEVTAIRSTDKGATWSAPIKIADLLSVGAFDPDTRLAIRDAALLPQVAVAPNGTLYVVWQDGRFTGGQIDGIAFSQSADGGLSWSTPVQINGVPTAQAFTPQIHVLADGTVGVTYYDLRSNTPDLNTLPTEYWLTRSRDGGLTWRETRVAGPFDLAIAPSARGLFLGDYQGLASVGGRFLTFFAQTTRAALANPTDIFAVSVPPVAPIAAANGGERAYRAAAAVQPPSVRLRARTSATIVRVMEARIPGWSTRAAPRAAP